MLNHARRTTLAADDERRGRLRNCARDPHPTRPRIWVARPLHATARLRVQPDIPPQPAGRMIDWYSRYSSMPSGPSSRPNPDFLKPPKGERKSSIRLELMETQPVRTLLASCSARPMSAVQTRRGGQRNALLALLGGLLELLFLRRELGLILLVGALLVLSFGHGQRIPPPFGSAREICLKHTCRESEVLSRRHEVPLNRSTQAIAFVTVLSVTPSRTAIARSLMPGSRRWSAALRDLQRGEAVAAPPTEKWSSNLQC